jgi:metal-responsive CopG/Arc/MetJ family transcriptional regulator
MAAERITITLPARVAKRVRDKAKKTGTPVSQIIAEALKEQEDALLREQLIKGYREMAKLNKELAEEGIHAFREVLGLDPKG